MRVGRLAVRVVAVAVLVLGIVLMHHVMGPGNDSSAAHDQSPGSGLIAASDDAMGMGDAGGSTTATAGDRAGDGAMSGEHGLLHLCLAVLTAAAVVLLGWLLLIVRSWMPVPPLASFRARPLPARPPPRPHGSALLTSLCVMRT